MQRDARLFLGAQPVDVVRPEQDGAASCDDGAGVHAANARARLDQRAADDSDGSRRNVVVVPACVVAPGPADEPDIDVLVAVDRSVIAALRSGVADLVGPQLWAAG